MPCKTVFVKRKDKKINDNQIIAVDSNTVCPLENTVEKLLMDVRPAINMGHLMHLKHPSKYRHVLILIREMANEELYHLDRKAV